VFEGVIYKEGKASFLSYFSDFGGVWDTWCKFGGRRLVIVRAGRERKRRKSDQ